MEAARGVAMLRGSARSFTMPVCKAAQTSAVEGEEIVAVGSFAPENIHVPTIYVDRVVQGESPRYELSG